MALPASPLESGRGTCHLTWARMRCWSDGGVIVYRYAVTPRICKQWMKDRQGRKVVPETRYAVLAAPGFERLNASP